ncbi:hypothetical protein [Deinococcus misasensis]|uniref:hypothetical protein n=1 Tax=Deinococcus misasensis TaxID=392413 RepID=UPI00054E2CF9|nr:hypothetical protein [Deinococcus misasensis]
MDFYRLIHTPRLFDFAVVNATKNKALDDLLVLLHSSGQRSTTLTARMGWVLFQLQRDEEARDLLDTVAHTLLGRGYLARVLYEFAPSPHLWEMYLQWTISQIDGAAADSIEDVEGIAHLNIAAATFLIGLKREDEALPFLQEAESNSKMIGLASVNMNAKYQRARRLWAQDRYSEVAPLLSEIATSTGGSQHVVDTSTRLLFWACLLGGADLPEGAPADVQAALKTLQSGERRFGVHDAELKSVTESWADCRRLLTFLAQKFPFQRGKRTVSTANAMLQQVLAHQEAQSPNVYRNPMVCMMRLLALAALRKPEALEEARSLQGYDLYDMQVLHCMRSLALIQASVGMQECLFSREDVQALLGGWQKCSTSQRQMLTLYMWEFCPSVPFIVADHGGLNVFPLKSHPVAHIEEAVMVVNHQVVPLPRISLSRYVAAGPCGEVLELDLKKLAEMYPEGVAYRVHVEEWAGPVRKWFNLALLDSVALRDVR